MEGRLAGVDWEAGTPGHGELLAFYHPETLKRLCALRAWLRTRDAMPGGLDTVDDWIRMVALNRLTGHSPGFFSGYTLPPNQAASVAAQMRINERLGKEPPERDIAQVILRKSRSLLRGGGMAPHPAPMLLTGDAASTPAVPSGSIDLAVTSPPFLDVVDYAGDNWLRFWFAGIDPAAVRFSRHHSEAAWRATMSCCLAEIARVVRPGGYVAFEVGEVRNATVLLEKAVWQAASGLPLDRVCVMVNRQMFTKTANCWGVANNARGTNTNRVVILRRQ